MEGEEKPKYVDNVSHIKHSQSVHLPIYRIKLNNSDACQTRRETELANSASFCLMSVLVFIFINFIFGAVALAISIHAHKLWMQDKDEKKAVFWGRVALFLNVMGIVISMTAVIVVFSTGWIIQYSSKDGDN